MEIKGRFFNLAHVAVVGPADGASLSVWMVGCGDDPFLIPCENTEDAQQVRRELVARLEMPRRGENE